MSKAGAVPDFRPGKEALQTIKAAIAAYNADRVGTESRASRNGALMLIPYVITVVFFAFLLLPGQNADDFPWTAYWIGLGVAAFGAAKLWEFAWSPVRKLQQNTRSRLVPVICGFVENIRYDNKATPDFMLHLPRESLVVHDRVEHDDLISGRHEGMDFELGEVIFWIKSGKNSEARAFEGVIFHCRAKTAFPGLLIASQKTTWFDRFGRGGRSERLSDVACSNKRIDEKYEFRSDRPAEASRLVDGPLTTIILWLADNWPEGVARIALDGDHILLLVPTEKNHFELPNISVDLDYERHVAPMTGQLWRLLSTGRLIRDILN